MTNKPDLGPILLGAGLAVALAAVIAGFIGVGGPGNARAERLDAQLETSLRALAVNAQCAYLATGKAPVDYAEMDAANEQREWPDDPTFCTRWFQNQDRYPDIYEQDFRDTAEISYSALDESQIRLCARFRLPIPETAPQWSIEDLHFHRLPAPETPEAFQCFDIDLSRTRFYD